MDLETWDFFTSMDNPARNWLTHIRTKQICSTVYSALLLYLLKNGSICDFPP